MAVQAGGKALAASGLSAADIDLVIVATCTLETPDPQRLGRRGAPPRHRRARRVRRERRLRRLLLRAGRRQRRDPRAARPRTCWSSARRSSRSGSTGPTGPPPSSSPTAPAPRWSGPSDDARHRPGRLGQRRATSPSAIIINDRNGFLHQEGQTVFRWATTALHPVAKQACERAGRRPVRAGRVRPAPGQPAHHRGHRAQARRRQRRRRRATSSRPATPPPPRSRWRCRACSSAARSVRAGSRCCSASAPA